MPASVPDNAYPDTLTVLLFPTNALSKLADTEVVLSETFSVPITPVKVAVPNVAVVVASYTLLLAVTEIERGLAVISAVIPDG